VTHFRGTKGAFGAPGDEALWTGAAKDGVGTAHSFGGRVWFTIGRGILTEVYYPTIDRPQIRDLEFLFSDEKGLPSEMAWSQTSPPAYLHWASASIQASTRAYLDSLSRWLFSCFCSLHRVPVPGRLGRSLNRL
jgi:hypothetical protein